VPLAEELACEVGIGKALVEEQRDHPAAPDFRQSFVGAQRNEEEPVMTVESAYQHVGVRVRVPWWHETMAARLLLPAACVKQRERMSKSSLPMSAKRSRS